MHSFVHGDDFLSTAIGSSLAWLTGILEKELDIKTEVLGPAGEERCTLAAHVPQQGGDVGDRGLRYEADPRHAEIMIAQLGLQGSHTRGVTTAGVKEAGPRSEDDFENPLLDAKEASCYRGLAARANFLSQDRLDLQYASKELSRWMANPRRGDWDPMKRFARYLILKPRATLFYGWQSMPTEVTAFSDTDWVGCKST